METDHAVNAPTGAALHTERTCMKTDSELKKDVIAELEWDAEIKAPSVGVAVKDGVVTVSGHLDTYAEKFAIERALRRLSGVKAIALELDVVLADLVHQSADGAGMMHQKTPS